MADASPSQHLFRVGRSASTTPPGHMRRELKEPRAPRADAVDPDRESNNRCVAGIPVGFTPTSGAPVRPPRTALHALLLMQVACATQGLPSPGLRQLAELQGDIDFVTGDVSADSRYLAEIDWDSGDLRLVDLQTGEVRGVTGDGYEGGGYAWTSAFSGEGDRVALAWYREAHRRHELRIAERSGSGSRLLVPVSDSVQYIDPLDWTPVDDQILVALRGEDLAWRLGLVRVDDGSLRVLKKFSWLAPGGEQTYPNAYISPDGRFIAYDYRPDVETHGRDIYAQSIDGARETRLLSDVADDRVLGWLPDGNGILF